MSSAAFAPRLPILAQRRRLRPLRLENDERLVHLTREGNEAAFEVLVERYHKRLLVYCRNMVRSPEDARDLLQEVFVNAHRAMLRDQRPIQVKAWLYKIARNRCLNHLRRPQPDTSDLAELAEDATASAADIAGSREDMQALVRDVQTLPETQRTALVLREMEALSYDQIAAAMDKTVPAVKSLLVRARINLAEKALERAA